MSTSDGKVTNAVYGFTSMLAIVLASRPEFAVAAFDVGAPTFRSKEYVEYKAGRRAMPDDLRPQIEMVREVLEAFSIPIHGVPGVGDKTAAKLVQDFGTIEALLERVEELPEGRLKTSLKANADQVRLGKRMVTIVRDVPVELDLETARWTRYDYDKARTVFDRMEFRQLLSRFPPPDQVPVQPSLTFEAPPEPAGLKVVDDAA